MAVAALALAVCAGLAGCGGSGPGGGDQVIIVPDPPRKSPDLVVESAVASDSGPSTGAGFTLSVTVRNAGSGAAAATTARFYRSDDETITASDEEAGAVDVGELAATGSATASVELTAPSTSGTYYYGACVDAMAEESDTGNNCSASARVTVVEPPPDLVVESATVSDAGPTAGSGFTLSVTVRNAGNGAATGTTVRFYRSADATISASDEQVGDSAVVEPAASGRAAASVELTAPSSPGTYYYGACADAVEGESDTANNCSASVQVTVPAPALEPRLPFPALNLPRPDIVIASFSVTRPNPAVGGVFALYATLRNIGRRPSARFLLRTYRSDDAAFTSSDPQVATQWVREMPAKGKLRADRRFDTPDEYGTYYYRVCADAVPGETNASNNCSAAVKIVVSHAKPDLRVISSGAGNWRGNTFPIEVDVRNFGGPAPATTLRFYHSTDRTFTSSDTELANIAVPALIERHPHIGLPVFNSGGVYVPGPTTPGTHYYGACVDAVPDESDTTNNCKYVHRIRR